MCAFEIGVYRIRRVRANEIVFLFCLLIFNQCEWENMFETSCLWVYLCGRFMWYECEKPNVRMKHTKLLLFIHHIRWIRRMHIHTTRTPGGNQKMIGCILRLLLACGVFVFFFFFLHSLLVRFVSFLLRMTREAIVSAIVASLILRWLPFVWVLLMQAPNVCCIHMWSCRARVREILWNGNNFREIHFRCLNLETRARISFANVCSFSCAWLCVCV